MPSHKQLRLRQPRITIIRSSLKRDGKELIAQGKVSKNEYDSFTATYQAYKALGGDGWADGIKAKVDLLERDCED